MSGTASDDVRRMIQREKRVIDGARRMRQTARNKVVRSQCDSQIAEASRNIAYLQARLDRLHLEGRKAPNTQPKQDSKVTRLDVFRWDKPQTMGPRIQLMLQQLEYKLNIEEQYERGTRKLVSLYQQTGDRKSQAEAQANLAESTAKMALLKRSKKRYSDMNLASISDGDEDMVESGFENGAEQGNFATPNVKRPLTGMLRIFVKQIEDVDHTIAWTDQVEMWISMTVENNSDAAAHTRASRSSLFNENFSIPVDKGNEIEFTVYDRPTSGSGATPVALMWLRISDIAEAIRRKRVERELRETGWASAARVQELNEKNDNRGSAGDVGTSSDSTLSAGSAPSVSQSSAASTLASKSAGNIPAAAAAAATTNTSDSTGPVSSAASGASTVGGSATSAQTPHSQTATAPSPPHTASAAAQTTGSAFTPDSVEGWFTLEPAGRVYLRLGFDKTGANPRTPRARVYGDDLARLGRHNAIRKREETQQVHGHEFVLHQAYNIVRCAVCGDFTTSHFQCQKCHLSCDRKCFSKVVTKCTALMSQDPDEELNHRIPHQFEPTTNMKATWCAQCGYILPLASRKNVRKCIECGIMVHTSCTGFVPDLCGMSMETASQVMSEINSTRIRQATKAAAESYRTQPRSHTQAQKSYSERQSQYGVQKPLPAQPHSSAHSPSPSHSHSPSHTHSHSQSQTQLRNAATGKVSPVPPPRKGPIRRKEVPAPPTVKAPAPPVTSGAIRKTDSPTWMNSQGLTQAQSQAINPSEIGTEIGAETKARNQLPAQLQTQPQGQTPSQYQSQMSQSVSSKDLFNTSIPPQTPAHSSSGGTDPQQLSSASMAALHDAVSATLGQDSTMDPFSNDERQEPSKDFPTVPSTFNPFEKPAAATPPAAPAARRRRKIGLDDFSFLAVLGKGNFGKVMLAESKQSGQLYAVKVLKKNFIIENREVESTRSEKRVFLIANRERHPFLVNLFACFQTENRVYFVMDYVSGGDLMFHIQQKMFSAKRAQFYAAEVLLALKHFHDNDVIYRDLKLDNILLNLDGHIKVADYGLCKENMGFGKTTGTFCGTPDFIAPEILLDQKYGRSVDWWALGVLMYQMLLGKSPFHGNDEDEVYDAILSDEPLYPIHMPRDSVSILQQLLTRDPTKRLGSGARDAEEVMAHSYFANINFDELLSRRVEPPYKPEITSPTDVRYFERDFTSEKPALTPMNSMLTAEMQEEFRGFSYSLGDSI